MRIPTSVVIGAHRWRVVVDRDSMLLDSDACHGAVMARRHLIALDGALEGTSLQEVLLHEILHACLAGHMMEPDDEEAVVNAAAGPLLDALRRNPRLVACLLA